MRIFALDLSTSETGWALFDDAHLLKSGVIKVPQNVDDSALKIIHVAEEVIKFLRTEQIEELVSEDIFMSPRMFSAFNILAQLKGAILFAFYKCKLRPPEHISAVSARSLIGITPNVKKDLIIKEFNKKFKTNYTNHNEVDALIQGIAYLKKSNIIKKSSEVIF